LNCEKFAGGGGNVGLFGSHSPFKIVMEIVGVAVASWQESV